MSPAAPKPYYPEIDDPPKPFDVEQHQVDVLRADGRREKLWEFLEKLEEADKTSTIINERR